MRLSSKVCLFAATVTLAIGPTAAAHAATGPFLIGQKVVAGSTSYTVTSTYGWAQNAQAKTSSGLLGCFSTVSSSAKDTKATLYVTRTSTRLVYKVSCSAAEKLPPTNPI